MSAPMLSTSFRAVVEPILNEVFDGVYDQRKDEWKGVIVERQGTPRAYHEEPVLYGFQAAPELPDGMPVNFQQGGTLFIQRYVYKVYGTAFAMTRTLIEDGDHIRIGSIYSEHQAQAMIETKETLAANMFNRAFNASYTGGDGVTLINSAHPTASGTYSNVLATAAVLSQTSLEQMLIQVRSAVDDTGKKVRITPRKLVVSPSNMMQAEVLIKSVLRAGSANNDVNPVRAMGMLSEETAVLSRMTSTTAWFILTDAPRGLQLMMRRKLDKAVEGDFQTDSTQYKTTERYAPPSWTNARALWGTAGA